MMEMVQDLDNAVLAKINHQWTNPFMDQFFVWATNIHHDPIFLYSVLPLFLGIILIIYKMQAVRMILTLALTIGVTDMMGARIFKPFFNRTRPHLETHAPATLRMEFSPGNGSFPSNHAMNSFAVATVVTHFIPWMTIPFFIIAFIGGYSRLYLGVHYPTDVVAGAVIGIFLALAVIRLTRVVPFMRRTEPL